jgi:hypothetical protein
VELCFIGRVLAKSKRIIKICDTVLVLRITVVGCSTLEKHKCIVWSDFVGNTQIFDCLFEASCVNIYGAALD